MRKQWKNQLIFIFVWLVRPFISRHPQQEHDRILVVTTTGLGDTVWATPTLKTLKELSPSARIDILTTALGKEVLLHNPHVQQTYVLAYQPLIQLWKTLLKNQYNTIIILHASDRKIFPLAALLGATKIVCSEGDCKGLEKLMTHTPAREAIHEIDRRLHLLAPLYSSPQLEAAMTKSRKLEMPLTTAEQGDAATILKQWGWKETRPLVILQPGAKDQFKEWPSEYYARTAYALMEFNPLILINGSVDEAQSVKKLSSQIPKSRPLIGQYSLRQFLGILSHASLMITNDTGPMHLAFSQEIPTIALFGPTDPELCGPINAANAHVIAKEKTCTPCLRKKCRNPFCMRQIGVDEVVSQAKQLLEA